MHLQMKAVSSLFLPLGWGEKTENDRLKLNWLKWLGYFIIMNISTLIHGDVIFTSLKIMIALGHVMSAGTPAQPLWKPRLI